MLGDSLTAGFGVAAEEALPAVIERQLVEEGVNITIVNAGVSGDTTADALNRYDFSVGQANPDLLVVALGANDYLNGLDPKTALGNLNRLLDRAVKDEIPVALVGVSVPDGGGIQPEFETAYKAIYPDLARSYGAPLYPNMLASVAGRPDLLQEDGLHPTSEGIQAIAADMGPFLKTAIDSISVKNDQQQP
jgi:acyl-CoA thioesterase-1